MSKEDVQKWAEKYSPSYSGKFSPWKTEFDKMAQKTVLRRLIGTYGVMTPEIQMALEKDDHGNTPQTEREQKANTVPIDVSYAEVDPETGEIIGASPDEKGKTSQKLNPAAETAQAPEPAETDEFDPGY